MKIIPHNQPTVGKEELDAVARTIRRKWFLAGPEVEKFEKSIATFAHKKYALAVNSGSAALHLCLVLLGVKPNDEVIVPTYTDSALLNVIHYQGAEPVVVDIEKDGFNINPEDVKKKITKKTKAIIVPHTFGFPAKIHEIKKLGIPVIEDAAQALGSIYQNKPLGSFEDLSIFSFYTTKMLATGQGGIVTTNEKAKYHNLKDLINYDRRDNYIVRYNYQMTDIAASIGNAQFEKLPSFIKRRGTIAAKYQKLLDRKGVIYYPKKEEDNVNHYRFVVKFPDQKTRDSVQQKLARKGITTIPPLKNYQQLHNVLRLPKNEFPNAENISYTTLSLPIFPGLTEDDVAQIIVALDTVL